MLIILFLIVISIIAAALSQRNLVCINQEELYILKYQNFYGWYFFVSWFILTIICFLCKSGNDTGWYIAEYTNFSLNDLADLNIEIGYKVLCILLHGIVKDGIIGIGIIKAISLGFVFKAFYNLRNKISLWMAVLAYICLLYIYNFQLIRIMLAVGMVFLAYSHEFNNEKKQCIIWLLIALFFHYTSAVALLAYIGYLLIGKTFSIKKLVIMLACTTIIIYCSEKIILPLVQNIQYFNKYQGYINNSESGFGFGQLLLFLPLLFVILSYFKEEKNQKNYIFAIVLAMMTFLIGMLGYSYSTISRTAYYFYFVYMGYGASIPLKCYTSPIISFGARKTFSVQTWIIIIMLLYMFVSYICAGGLVNAGLDYYHFIWE